jgi:hypothetical protein
VNACACRGPISSGVKKYTQGIAQTRLPAGHINGRFSKHIWVTGSSWNDLPPIQVQSLRATRLNADCREQYQDQHESCENEKILVFHFLFLLFHKARGSPDLKSKERKWNAEKNIGSVPEISSWMMSTLKIPACKLLKNDTKLRYLLDWWGKVLFFYNKSTEKFE